jgi:hypothetical protein
MELVETLLGETPGGSQPLLDAGLDSLSAVELRNVLAAETGWGNQCRVHPMMTYFLYEVVTRLLYEVVGDPKP